jgi:hypothetical protein
MGKRKGSVMRPGTYSDIPLFVGGYTRPDGSAIPGHVLPIRERQLPSGGGDGRLRCGLCANPPKKGERFHRFNGKAYCPPCWAAKLTELRIAPLAEHITHRPPAYEARPVIIALAPTERVRYITWRGERFQVDAQGKRIPA